MKQLVYILVMVYACFSCSVAYAGEAEEWMKTTEQSEGDGLFTETQIRAFLKKAEPIIQKGSDNPYFYMTLGDFVKALRSYYHRSLLKAGKIYRLNAPENQALIKEYQSYYQKAMDLDDNPDAPEHLTVMMLNGIGSDSVGDPAIKVRALEKAAALARAGKNIGGSEMFEWNTYEARVGIYVDAKDYANALKIVNEMLERFPNTRTDELLNWKQEMEAKVEKQKQQAAAQDAYAQADTYTTPKAAPVQQPVKAVEPKKSKKPKASKETPASESYSMLWWLLGGGIALLGVIVLLMRRKKS